MSILGEKIQADADELFRTFNRPRRIIYADGSGFSGIFPVRAKMLNYYVMGDGDGTYSWLFDDDDPLEDYDDMQAQNGE